MKKKVAIFLYKTDLTGGPGNSIINCLKYFDREKFDYSFVATSKGELTEELTKRGFSVSFLKYGEISKFNPFPFVFSVFKCVFFLKLKRIDIIHFQFDYYRDPFLVAAKVAKVKTLIHVRGPAMELDSSWQYLSDAFIFNSHFTKKRADFKHPKQFVVHNGIDPELVPTYSEDKITALKKDLALSESDKVLAIVSRIHPAKHIEYFVQAAALIDKEIPASFLIIGDIQQEEYHQELLALQEELGLKQKLFFVGHAQEVFKYYYLIDCLVHTALEEPFGRIYLEAALCKTPIASFNAGGAKEILTSNNSILVEPKNVKELSRQIVDLLSNSELRQKLSEQAYQDILNKFHAKKIQKEIEEVYAIL